MKRPSHEGRFLFVAAVALEIRLQEKVTSS